MRNLLLMTILFVGLIACENVPEEIAISSITINIDRVDMIVGESLQLSATVSPTNASETVIWSSSKQSVASISESGLVTAIAEGSSTITAFAGGKTATCLISVENSPVTISSIELNRTNAKLTVGETMSLTAVIKPDNATDKSIIWASSSPEVATVEDGLVKAVGVGSTRITASAGDKSAVCIVSVTEEYASRQHLQFEVLTSGSIRMRSRELNSLDSENKRDDYVFNNIEYSVNGGKTWEELKLDDPYSYIIVRPGDIVLFRGNNKSYYHIDPKSHHTCYEFNFDGEINVSGNIMSLISSTDFWNEKSLEPMAFRGFFRDLKIRDASALLLPATKLADRCYEDMFSYCKQLEYPPSLPATEMEKRCYAGMFYECTHLVVAPELPAMSLAEECYEVMFSDCYSLKQMPYLPAKQLAPKCYLGMFYQTGLETIQNLPAETLAESCYYNMFRSCFFLVDTPTILPATVLADNCYSYMFSGCSSLSIAPILPATELQRGCYNSMFANCSRLRYIKAMFLTDPHDIEALTDWVDEVSNEGVFVKNKNAGWTGYIPDGWTIRYE